MSVNCVICSGAHMTLHTICVYFLCAMHKQILHKKIGAGLVFFEAGRYTPKIILQYSDFIQCICQHNLILQKYHKIKNVSCTHFSYRMNQE